MTILMVIAVAAAAAYRMAVVRWPAASGTDHFETALSDELAGTRDL
jgi:hypothetical protein